MGALLHRRQDLVALLGRVENRGLHEARLLAQVLELHRLAPGHAAHPAVLIGLHDAPRRLDLEVLTLEHELAAVGHVATEELPFPADAHVHLLDLRAAAPPFRDERWVGERVPDDVARGTEHALKANLSLTGGRDRDA